MRMGRAGNVLPCSLFNVLAVSYFFAAPALAQSVQMEFSRSAYHAIAQQQNAKSPNASSAWVLSTRGFGPVTLGMTPDEAKKASGGRMIKSGSDGGFDEFTFKGLGMEVRAFSCFDARPIGSITLGGVHGQRPRFATDRGIKVGAHVDDLKRAYGSSLKYVGKESTTARYRALDAENPNLWIEFEVSLDAGALRGLISRMTATWEDKKKCRSG